MTAARFADPNLVATTPSNVLLASAINGFDKGIETLDSHRATPLTDATGSRGLKILHTSLPAPGSGRREGRTM
jgi:alcohol dehydrogenase